MSVGVDPATAGSGSVVAQLGEAIQLLARAQHHRADPVGFSLQIAQVSVERREHGDVERVALVRAIERQRSDAIGIAPQDEH
mgnify:CR=1 FL=1